MGFIVTVFQTQPSIGYIRSVRRFLLLLFFLSLFLRQQAQLLGGKTLFTFSKAAVMPQAAALGGVNVSQLGNDVGLAFTNPALLHPSMHLNASFVFHQYPAGIRVIQSMTAYHLQPLSATLALGVHYVDYGSLPQTDAAGNILGQFRPGDYLVQAMVSRSYLNRWRYGATLKFLHSSYGLYRSAALALDVGIAYTDSAQGWRMAFTANHMGTVLQKYRGTESAELPFDLRLGISKKLRDAPLQLSLNAHHLHQFNLLYTDTTQRDLPQPRKTFAGQVLSHLVLGAQAYVGNRIEISAGYNFLRRRELNIGNAGNGWNGFSMGIGVLWKRMQLRYARSYFGSRQATNQLGISLSFQNNF